MTIKEVYRRNSQTRRMLSASVAGRILIMIVLLLFLPDFLKGQEEPEYDEISILLEVKGIGALDIPAVIRNEDLYLPITDLFDFLRIKNVPASGLDSISGFFIDQEARYYISRPSNKIIYREKLFELPDGDLIRTDLNLYLKSSWFGSIFGLNCAFHFRSLSAVITTELELPLIREMKQEEMRLNLSRLRGDFVADRTIGRTYPKFRFGMADWSAISSQEINGQSEARLNLSLGAMVLGGETNLSLNYNSMTRFTEKQQQYLWRYVDNDFSPLRQVSLGKIRTDAIASIYNPVVGVQLTNAPTTYRRSFGSYTLSDNTEPGWIVELYVNNVLVDYKKADASGFYTFDVPLVYGNSHVQLKFYGPWGEEKSEEKNIVIPFNFLPEKTLEYTVSAGMVEDSLFSRFSRGSVNYGILRNLTVGGGVEYLSSVTTGPVMPFLKTSVRLGGNILLFGEYTYGVRARGNLSYRTPSNIQFEVNYIKYDKDQTAINYKYLEERRISASAPLRIKGFSAYNRLSYNQIILPASDYATGEWLFSGSAGGLNANMTTYGVFIDELKPYFYSNLSVSARLPARFVIMPQMQYSLTKNEVLSAKLKVEKHLGDNAFMNLSFERLFAYGMNIAELGIRYDFSFARTGFSIRQSGKRTTFIEQASGSLITDPSTHFMTYENRPNVGRGGITVIPFFDLNNNNLHDQGEPRVAGLNLRINGGRVLISEKDTTIRVTGLEPYTSYYIELDGGGFESITWQLPFKTISVKVDPNILKTVEVPVLVVGEASGTVYLEEDGIRTGQDRVIVNFYNDRLEPAGRLLSESDGYFSLFGLKPGNYFVRPDTAQLRKLSMTSEPDSIFFTVKGGKEGDFIEGLDFTLRKIIPPELPDEEVVPPVPVLKKDTSYIIVHEVVEELVTISEDCWAIQLGAFRQRRNAEAMRRKLEKIFGTKVDIVVADNFYKVRISDIKTRAEVDEKIEVLRRNGITELWVITLKAKQQHRILVERSDSVAYIRDRVDSSGVRPVVPSQMSIQVGAFRNEGYAVALQKRLSTMVDNPVEIVLEDDLYKVRVTGFTSRLDLERLLPTLGMMGLRDLWVPPVTLPADTVVTVILPEDLPAEQAADSVVAAPDVLLIPPVPADTLAPLPEIKPEEMREPEIEVIAPYALRVGEYIKRSQALRAQRKIRKDLELESEII
ncbi:MAG: SPOR domain-containing protein, partial [Bacteroidales bacterium]|nr:SPOR domain-containing protein [Bacteroidales bacterium]MBN2634394.1 SPOR domain-containing protein [Bacteroidales bacterium]